MQRERVVVLEITLTRMNLWQLKVSSGGITLGKNWRDSLTVSYMKSALTIQGRFSEAKCHYGVNWAIALFLSCICTGRTKKSKS